ncbi:hypothetical protein, partial [Pseudomonas sp. CFBP 13715]
ASTVGRNGCERNITGYQEGDQKGLKPPWQCEVFAGENDIRGLSSMLPLTIHFFTSRETP